MMSPWSTKHCYSWERLKARSSNKLSLSRQKTFSRPNHSTIWGWFFQFPMQSISSRSNICSGCQPSKTSHYLKWLSWSSALSIREGSWKLFCQKCSIYASYSKICRFSLLTLSNASFLSKKKKTYESEPAHFTKESSYWLCSSFAHLPVYLWLVLSYFRSFYLPARLAPGWSRPILTFSTACSEHSSLGQKKHRDSNSGCCQNGVLYHQAKPNLARRPEFSVYCGASDFVLSFFNFFSKLWWCRFNFSWVGFALKGLLSKSIWSWGHAYPP